jgi:transposase
MAGRGAPSSRPAAVALRASEARRSRAGLGVLPRRWVVEGTFVWFGQARRLAKDYEGLPESGVAVIHWVMSRIMLRRLVSAAR